MLKFMVVLNPDVLKRTFENSYTFTECLGFTSQKTGAKKVYQKKCSSINQLVYPLIKMLMKGRQWVKCMTSKHLVKNDMEMRQY